MNHCYTPRMDRILQRSKELAHEHSTENVGTEHVLLALLEDSRAIATGVIAKFADTDLVVDELRRIMATDSYRGVR